MLSDDQIERYSRHIILGDVGGAGQMKFLNGSVLIVGVGGLGSPAALYLAAAGVGKIGLVDADVVDLTNLQRQVIHHTPDVNRAKVESAKNKINEMNPDVEVVVYQDYLGAENIADIIKEYDFIIDGVDNFPSKFLINDACVMHKKPYSHAGILRFDGQLFTYVPEQRRMLSLHLPTATSSQCSSKLFTSRRFRRFRWSRWYFTSYRSIEIYSW